MRINIVEWCYVMFGEVFVMFPTKISSHHREPSLEEGIKMIQLVDVIFLCLWLPRTDMMANTSNNWILLLGASSTRLPHCSYSSMFN